MGWHEIGEVIRDWFWAPFLALTAWLIGLHAWQREMSLRVRNLEAAMIEAKTQRAENEARHDKQRAEDREALKDDLNRLFAEIRDLRSDVKEHMRRGG